MRKGTLLILLGATAFVGLVFYLLANVEPVKVVASRLETKGASVVVQGEIKNTGPDVGPIDLDIRFYDRGGRNLGEDKVQVGGLKSGAAAKFSSRPLELSGATGFSIYLNHGRNPYGN
ncbi:MAG TPA: FxLYD domain-containing protein [Candidatus Binataceae bacterium]